MLNATSLQPQDLLHQLHLKPRATRWSPCSAFKKHQGLRSVGNHRACLPPSLSIAQLPDYSSLSTTRLPWVLSFSVFSPVPPLVSPSPFSSLQASLFPKMERKKKPYIYIFFIRKKSFPLFPSPFPTCKKKPCFWPFA